MTLLHTPDRYKKADAWPHKFLPLEKPRMGDNGLWWTPMTCYHCNVRYTAGRDQKPIGVCPKRRDRDELIRLIGKNDPEAIRRVING